MSEWLDRVLSSQPGFEREIVERYTARLLDLARQRLPDRVRQRVDPEDLVQSVYHSFFCRLNDGRFSFDESADLWRLLAAMTFQRINNAVRFHQQQRRDVRREQRSAHDENASRDPRTTDEFADRQPGPDDLARLFESLECLLERLPEKYRDIAALQLEGHSLQEIANRVQRSRRTVYRAQQELQQLAVQLMEVAE